MEWFYADGGNRVGPISPETFEERIKSGVVKADTLVWSSSMTEWQAFQLVSAETATCAASQGRYWKRDMVPYEGKFISAAHKEAFFQRLREGVTLPGQLSLATIGARFLAALIDGIVGWVASMIINFFLAFAFFGAFSFAPQMADAEMVGRFMAFQGVSMLLSLGFGVTYNWFFMSRYAATPGKLALGLKVVRADGAALTNGRIIGRHFSQILSGMILGIGYIMAFFDEERRALHDRICDTRVIKAP